MSKLHDEVKDTEAPITNDAISDDRGEMLRVRSNLRAGTVLTCTPVATPVAAAPAAAAAAPAAAATTP